MDTQVLTKIENKQSIPENASGVYRLLFSSGKSYIGRSQNIKSRIYEHLSKMKSGKHSNNNMLLEYEQFGYPEIFIHETTDTINVEKQLIWGTSKLLNENIPVLPVRNVKSTKTGCYWNKSRNKWTAKYKNKHLGTYDTEEDAYNAYLKAKSI